jgi:hypothetical protein
LAREQQTVADLEQEAIQAEFHRKTSLADLRIQEAAITPGKEDDIFRIDQKITLLKHARDKFKKYSQDWIDLQSEILALETQKKGVGGGGFTLKEFYDEGLKQFNEFASNVSSSVLTPGAVRGTLGGAVAAQNPGISQVDSRKLDAAATTNSLLADILGAIRGQNPKDTVAPGVHADDIGPPGYATHTNAARMAVVRGPGA